MRSKQLTLLVGIHTRSDGGIVHSAEAADAIGYMDTLLMQCHLPHVNPLDATGNPITRWHHRQGKYAITLQSGTVSISTDDILSPPPYVGLPFGSHARLFLAAIMRYAKRYKQRNVPLGSGPTMFAKQMGLVEGGFQSRSVADQALRIATSLWQFGLQNSDGTVQQMNTLLCDEFNAVVNKERTAGRWTLATWPTEIVLSHAVYDRLIDHGAPYEIDALKALSGNPRAMDMYCFFATRLFRIPHNKPLVMSFVEFAKNFDQSRGPVNPDKLLPATRKALQQALSAYPQAAQSVSIERDATRIGRPAMITMRYAAPAIPLRMIP